MSDEWPLAEPYRIKMVETISLPSPGEREEALTASGFNPFRIPARSVYIDLLTDSGTSAMSQEQWAALMTGDESYAGSRSFFELEESIREILGFPLVLPTHQGRAAEHIVMKALSKPGDLIPNNLHFDTTKAHVLASGAVPVDTVIPEGEDSLSHHPFKGNVDTEKLEKAFREGHVPFVIVTVTSNQNGGQPVSLENLRKVRQICDAKGVPLFLDAARFAENAFFIKEREVGQDQRTVREIVREMMDIADGVLVSAKKDPLVNIGGFIAVRDKGIYEEIARYGILYEGFSTYGGLAGRDLAAMAQGVRESVDEDHLAFRIGQVRRLHQALHEAGVPLMSPCGGHGVYIDANRLLPHIPRDAFPGWALSIELYRERAIRTVEVGTVLSGRNPKTKEHDYPAIDLVRLAIPRRVYTNSHMDQVALATIRVARRAASVRGYRFIEEPPILRHFSGIFAPI